MTPPLASPTRRRLMQLAASVCTLTMIGVFPGMSLGAVNGGIRRRIPGTDETLPVIGLGTYRTFDVGSATDERDRIREVLRRFVKLGGTVVDSSPMYGRAESVVGDLADELGAGEKLFRATKVWTRGRESGIKQMNASFERMGANRMDLMQIHNLLDLEAHIETLREWKAQGRIRYIGITHYQAGAYDALERLMRTGEFDFVQLNHSIAEREAEERLLPLAMDTETGVLVNRPFAHAGLFQKVRGRPLPPWATEIGCTTWAQFFLKYIVAHPAVTCVIPATSNPDHLVDNMGAGIGRLPDQAMRQRMAALMDTM